jgi:PAS domain S-box-containing protein
MDKYIKYFLFFIFIFSSVLCFADVNNGMNKQKKTIDSLLLVLKNSSTIPSSEFTPTIKGENTAVWSDTIRIKTLNNLSWELMYNNPDTAIILSTQALDLSMTLSKTEKIQSQLGRTREMCIANSYHLLAMLNGEKGNYSLALNYNFKALKIRESLNLKKGTSTSLSSIGTNYANQGDYTQALNYYFKALKINEELKNKYLIASILCNIGVVYKDQGDYSRALDNYTKALRILEEVGNKSGIAVVLGNIGGIYEQQGDHPKTLDYYFKAFKLDEELQNKNGMARHLGNIGNVYQNQAKAANSKHDFAGNDSLNKKALTYCLKALKIFEELGAKRDVAINLCNIGGLYIDEKKYNEAEKNLQKALMFSTEIKALDLIEQIEESLSNLYSTTQQPAKALEHYKKYITTKDSIFNEENTKKAVRSEVTFEFEKKQAVTKAEQEKQNAITHAKIEKQNFLRNALVIGFVMLLILVFFIYRSYRQKQTANTSLELLNKELEKLSIVASETDNGVLICGPKGEIEWANPGITRLLGYTLEDIKKRGNTLEEVSANPKIKSLIRLSIENKKSSVYQSLSITKDGRERWMQSTLTPILDAFGNIKKLVVIDTDITNQKIAEDELKLKSEKIIDSINYAQLIQQSILIEESEIQKQLPDSFIYYLPKDIVSGDFYWFSKVNDKIILAAIDCTGHGVPGAFMSMIGNTLLNQIVNEKHITQPSEILRLLNIAICEALHQQKDETLSRDGMDMALCCIDYKNNQIEYAGAQNPLFIISDNNIEVIKGDKQTIGGGGLIAKKLNPLNRKYSNHIIPIKKDLSIYIFSDGYTDQFGSSERKKFGTQKFKELLLTNQHLSMQQQKELIAKAHQGWKGNMAQIDDILIIGLRL